jgi:hypothetical protein
MTRRLAVVAIALACVVAAPAFARHRVNHHRYAHSAIHRTVHRGLFSLGIGLSSVAAVAERYVGTVPTVAELKGWARETGIGVWRHGQRAYCALGANMVLAKAGVAGSGSYTASSFHRWGVRTHDPQAGDIAVVGNHHVAVVVGRTGSGVLVVSFNDYGHAVLKREYPLRGIDYRTAGGSLAMR